MCAAYAGGGALTARESGGEVPHDPRVAGQAPKRWDRPGRRDDPPRTKEHRVTARPHSPGSPIYDQLVEEHGDVLNEARRLAEIAHQQADRVLGRDAPVLMREYAEQP